MFPENDVFWVVPRKMGLQEEGGRRTNLVTDIDTKTAAVNHYNHTIQNKDLGFWKSPY